MSPVELEVFVRDGNTTGYEKRAFHPNQISEIRPNPKGGALLLVPFNMYTIKESYKEAVAKWEQAFKQK
jgi:hypothetical protein